MLQRNRSDWVPILTTQFDQASAFQISRQRREKSTVYHQRGALQVFLRLQPLSRLKCCTAKTELARSNCGRINFAGDVTQPSNSIRYLACLRAMCGADLPIPRAGNALAKPAT
jgi:hypothetical protein